MLQKKIFENGTKQKLLVKNFWELIENVLFRSRILILKCLDSIFFETKEAKRKLPIWKDRWFDIASAYCTFSDFLSPDILVIQGSTLGPILFLCYINDFCNALSLFSVLFADDTTSQRKVNWLNMLTQNFKKLHCGTMQVKWLHF